MLLSVLAGSTGLEPATPGSTVQCANQLRHNPVFQKVMNSISYSVGRCKGVFNIFQKIFCAIFAFIYIYTFSRLSGQICANSLRSKDRFCLQFHPPQRENLKRHSREGHGKTQEFNPQISQTRLSHALPSNSITRNARARARKSEIGTPDFQIRTPDLPSICAENGAKKDPRLFSEKNRAGFKENKFGF